MQSVPITPKLWVRRVVDTTLCYKVCQLLAASRSFSLSTPVSSINKTDRHNIVPLNTAALTLFVWFHAVKLVLSLDIMLLFIDGLLSLNNSNFDDYVYRSHPTKLEFQDSRYRASYIVLRLEIDSQCRLGTKLFDKRQFHVFPLWTFHLDVARCHGKVEVNIWLSSSWCD